MLFKNPDFFLRIQSMNNLIKWNKKFADRPNQLMEPEPFLVENVGNLKPGSVLDIACGDGRNAIYLAREKFDVTGVDFSDEGLSRLNRFASDEGLKINTIQHDLEGIDEIPLSNKFDNIVVSHFKLSDALLRKIPYLLSSNGMLIYVVFNVSTIGIRAFPEDFCIPKGSLRNYDWPLKLQVYKEIFRQNIGYFDAYAFKLEK